MGMRASMGQMFKALWRFVTDLGAADAVPPTPSASGMAPPGWSDFAPPPGAVWPSVSVPVSQYDPIRTALDLTLKRFVDNVQEHLIFAPDERFSLRYLSLTGNDLASQALIRRFFNEFKDATTQHNIAVDAAKRNCAHGVMTDGQTTLRAELSAAELAPFDQWNAQLGAPADQPEPVSVAIVGEWTKPVAATAGPDAATLPPDGGVDVSQRQLTLDITDAGGNRSLVVRSLPLTFGRDSAGLAHALQGKFLSRVHGQLLVGAQNTLVWLNLSSNGSLVDGTQALMPGERSVLRNGARLALGRTQDVFATTPAECPLLVLRWAWTGSDNAATPVTVDQRSGMPTPINVAPGAAAGRLCNLAVQDAEGTRTCPVLTLPFTIGRDPASDCRIPEANKTVSRNHVELLAINADGARVRNHGGVKGWGTAVNGLEQPAEFTLVWGATMTLASRDTAGRPAQLQLQRADP